MADVVQEGGDDLLVAAVVLSGIVGRLKGVLELRDPLAVVLGLSGGAEEVENAFGRCGWVGSHCSLLYLSWRSKPHGLGVRKRREMGCISG